MNDSNTELDDRLRKVELLILDVDGVWTDGKLYYGSGGLELKAFNVQDGHAIKMLQAEIPVAIISGRTSDVVERRAAELGIAHLFQGVDDKPVALAELSKRTGIAPGRIAHMGDDIPDIALFAEVGLDIKRRSPFPTTFVIGLANGYNGYLPSPKQHELGGYETWRSSWSYLETEASTRITRSVLTQLRKLKAQP